MDYKHYIPNLALIFYRNLANEFYIESREFQEQNDSYLMGSSKPINQETLNHLIQAFTQDKEKEMTFKGIIPKNILHTNTRDQSILFYLKRPVRHLIFTSNLKIQDGKIELPNLLFHYKNKILHVYAFLDKVPNGHTQLYKAPFPNTTSSVCMGNVTIESPTNYWEDLMDTIDQAFFGSYFSEFHDNAIILGHLKTELNKCIKSKTPFPDKLLQPLNFNINSLL